MNTELQHAIDRLRAHKKYAPSVFNAHDIELLAAAVEQLDEEVERERIRLVACGVAAMQNTVTTIADRIAPDNQYYSASYGDVCRAVDREMDMRTQLDAANDTIKSLVQACETEKDRQGVLAEAALSLASKLTEANKALDAVTAERDRYKAMGRELADAAEKAVDTSEWDGSKWTVCCHADRTHREDCRFGRFTAALAKWRDMEAG